MDIAGLSCSEIKACNQKLAGILWGARKQYKWYQRYVMLPETQ